MAVNYSSKDWRERSMRSRRTDIQERHAFQSIFQKMSIVERQCCSIVVRSCLTNVYPFKATIESSTIGPRLVSVIGFRLKKGRLVRKCFNDSIRALKEIALK